MPDYAECWRILFYFFVTLNFYIVTSGKDCVFVLILDTSDKKHVFLISYSFFQDC